MSREAPYVHFVNHRSCTWPAEWQIALPVIGMRIHDDTLQSETHAVAVIADGLTVVVLGYRDAVCVWVEQQLRRIEAKALRRVPRSHYAIPVQLARPDIGHKRVPVMVSAIVNWV